MPKEILFRMPGQQLEVGWSKGGEATAKVQANLNPYPPNPSETISLSELDNAIAVLHRVRKQVFETSLVEALLDSTFLTNLAKNTPNAWGDGPVARLNVPNSEAWITYCERLDSKKLPSLEGISQFVKWDSTTLPVAKWGATQQHSAPLLYLREKKITEPTTVHWSKLIQRTKEGRLENAETYRTLFTKDFLMLNSRFDNFLELALRQAVFGSINMEFQPDVFVSIDYMFPEEAFVRATRNTLHHGIEKALERFQTNHDKAPTHAYLAAELFAKIKDPEDYPIKWCPAPPLPADYVVVVPHANKIAFVNWDGQPLRVIEGPSADFDAPKDHTGKFGKGWRAKDPSSTQILLEWSFVPVWDKYPVVVLELNEK